jgi:glutathione S-transferase
VQKSFAFGGRTLPRATALGTILGASPRLDTSERRQMNKLKLTYFDFPGGRAEPARLAMHIGGVPFEDYRFAPSDFSEVRKTTPLNQVPTLHVNDVQITQSDAITRYVGKLSGLYPEDNFQALLCDEVMGALEDINVKLGATFGKTGDDLKSARDALVTDALPKYLRWLPRVRQLNAQVIDCYEPGFKNVYYNRESCCG